MNITLILSLIFYLLLSAICLIVLSSFTTKYSSTDSAKNFGSIKILLLSIVLAPTIAILFFSTSSYHLLGSVIGESLFNYFFIIGLIVTIYPVIFKKSYDITRISLSHTIVVGMFILAFSLFYDVIFIKILSLIIGLILTIYTLRAVIYTDISKIHHSINLTNAKYYIATLISTTLLVWSLYNISSIIYEALSPLSLSANVITITVSSCIIGLVDLYVCFLFRRVLSYSTIIDIILLANIILLGVVAPIYGLTHTLSNTLPSSILIIMPIFFFNCTSFTYKSFVHERYGIFSTLPMILILLLYYLYIF